MKKLVILVVLVLAVVTVHAQESKKQSKKEKRAEKEAKQIEQTTSLLESKNYAFRATQALPSSGRSVNLDGSFSLRVKNDMVNCYLPFYGRAYSGGYGGGEGPFNFSLPMKNYNLEKVKKGYEVKFDVENKNDRIKFHLKVGNTGSSSLIVTSTNRQSISYHGNLEKNED